MATFLGFHVVPLPTPDDVPHFLLGVSSKSPSAVFEILKSKNSGLVLAVHSLIVIVLIYLLALSSATPKHGSDIHWLFIAR